MCVTLSANAYCHSQLQQVHPSKTHRRLSSATEQPFQVRRGIESVQKNASGAEQKAGKPARIVELCIVAHPGVYSSTVVINDKFDEQMDLISIYNIYILLLYILDLDPINPCYRTLLLPNKFAALCQPPWLWTFQPNELSSLVALASNRTA